MLCYVETLRLNLKEQRKGNTSVNTQRANVVNCTERKGNLKMKLLNGDSINTETRGFTQLRNFQLSTPSHFTVYVLRILGPEAIISIDTWHSLLFPFTLFGQNSTINFKYVWRDAENKYLSPLTLTYSPEKTFFYFQFQIVDIQR